MPLSDDFGKTPKEVLIKLLNIENDIIKSLVDELSKCENANETAKISNSIAYHNQCVIKLLDALKEEPKSEEDLLSLLNKKLPKKYLREMRIGPFGNDRKSDRKIRKRYVREP